MDEFLRVLRNELNKQNLDEEKKQSIIDDYRKTIKISLDAGFTIEEIISKIGDPRTIAKEYGGSKETIIDDDDIEDDDKCYYPTDNYSVKLNTLSSTVEIEYHDRDFIRLEANENFYEYYDVTFEKNQLFVKCAKRRFLKKVDIKFTIYLPSDIRISTMETNFISSKVLMDNLVSKDCKLSLVASTLDVDMLKSIYLNINNVSGSLNFDMITAEDISIDNVAGKINIDKVETNSCRLSNVTGSINIDEIDEDKVRKSSVLGNISLNK